MDHYLKSLSPWNGTLSPEDADKIWASYKLAGGGRDVSATLPVGGGLPSGDGGRSMLPNGGIFGSLMGGMSRPAGVPGDGAMQPTIGPGVPTAPIPQPQMKMGMPQGGLMGIAQGGQANGLMGLLQGMMKQQGPQPNPLPQAGMLGGGGPLPGMPGGPAGPSAADLGIPLNLSPMNQF